MDPIPGILNDLIAARETDHIPTAKEDVRVLFLLTRTRENCAGIRNTDYTEKRKRIRVTTDDSPMRPFFHFHCFMDAEGNSNTGRPDRSTWTYVCDRGDQVSKKGGKVFRRA